MLRHLFLAAMHERIVAHLIENGSTPTEASAGATAATSKGISGLLDWLKANGPELYAIARVIAALFGIPLPPLPV